MANRPTQKKNAAGRPAGLFTWVAVGVVVAVILVIVGIKVFSSSTVLTPDKAFQPTPASMVAQLTQVPAATFDAVGVTSPAVPVVAPHPVTGQPELLWPDAHGVTRPTVFYFGAEYCPFCAAERWPMIVALSRFGTFSNLGNSVSSSTDVYKNTPTFTFLHATYTSKYLNFVPVEFASNIPSTTGPAGYTALMKPTKAEQALVAKYDNPTYIPGLTGPGSIPFVSIDNRYFIVGASYSPAALEGVTRTQVAAGLSSSADRLTQGIISAANLITASVCVATKAQPTTVCLSPAVRAANHVLGIVLHK